MLKDIQQKLLALHGLCIIELVYIAFWKLQRASDGGNGNHSVSLPIILIKNKVDQKFPSSNISLLMVSIL